MAYCTAILTFSKGEGKRVELAAIAPDGSRTTWVAIWKGADFDESFAAECAMIDSELERLTAEAGEAGLVFVRRDFMRSHCGVNIEIAMLRVNHNHSVQIIDIRADEDQPEPTFSLWSQSGQQPALADLERCLSIARDQMEIARLFPTL